jgi:hypothetical protein
MEASVPNLPAIRPLNKAREKLDLTPLAVHDNYVVLPIAQAAVSG